MYAYTANSFRAIESATDVLLGELFANEVPDATLTAIRVNTARADISMLIQSTQWVFAPDAEVSAEQRAQYLAYRQALRELPNHPGFPDVSWPVLPANEQPGLEIGGVADGD